MTPDELVERVSLAIDSAICDGDQSSVAMELTSEEIKVLARAAIAVLRPALRSEAFEEAAKVCDAIESETWRLWKTHSDMLDQGRSDGAGDCAAAIRALMKQSTTEEESA